MHLTFEESRAEITVFNSLVRVQAIPENPTSSMDEAIEQGIENLFN